MQVNPLSLDGVYEITPTKHGDERGFFSEVYNARALQDHGIDIEFVQDNVSLSTSKGILRGLHFQKPPFAQDKLVRVLKGAILDVAVDLRSDSETKGQWLSLEVSAEKWNQILVPKGFAHGFITLTDVVEVAYKVSDYYDRDSDQSVKYNDPEIGIEWPDLGCEFTLSDKDRDAPLLSTVETGF